MVFLAIGVLIGPKVIGAVDVRPGGDTVRTLAEATLAVVLFADASRISIRELRREYSLPLRLLMVGLPLTIAAGTLVAKALFGALTFAEAAVLAVLLAPTDAALGQAVVVDEGYPEEIREGLNVESGLNDGLCVPLLFVAIAAADVESSLEGAAHAFTVAAEEIGFGLLAGVGAGLLAGAMVLTAPAGNSWPRRGARWPPSPPPPSPTGPPPVSGARGSSPRSRPGSASGGCSATSARSGA